MASRKRKPVSPTAKSNATRGAERILAETEGKDLSPEDAIRRFNALPPRARTTAGGTTRLAPAHQAAMFLMAHGKLSIPKTIEHLAEFGKDAKWYAQQLIKAYDDPDASRHEKRRLLAQIADLMKHAEGTKVILKDETEMTEEELGSAFAEVKSEIAGAIPKDELEEMLRERGSN